MSPEGSRRHGSTLRDCKWVHWNDLTVDMKRPSIFRMGLADITKPVSVILLVARVASVQQRECACLQSNNIFYTAGYRLSQCSSLLVL